MPNDIPFSALPSPNNTISVPIRAQFNFQPQSRFLCKPIKTKMARIAKGKVNINDIICSVASFMAKKETTEIINPTGNLKYV